jgi:hypothetical protein
VGCPRQLVKHWTIFTYSEHVEAVPSIRYRDTRDAVARKEELKMVLLVDTRNIAKLYSEYFHTMRGGLLNVPVLLNFMMLSYRRNFDQLICDCSCMLLYV